MSTPFSPEELARVAANGAALADAHAARESEIDMWLERLSNAEAVLMPLTVAGKRPVESAWQQTAATDWDAIEEHIRRGGNIGAHLGASRWVAWDGDNAAATAAMLDVGFDLFTVSAGSRNPAYHHAGGAHVLWRLPSWVPLVRLTGPTKAVVLDGGASIDVLAGNHQVAVPPSVVVIKEPVHYVGTYATASEAGYCEPDRDGWLRVADSDDGVLPELPLWALSDELLAYAPEGTVVGEPPAGWEPMAGTVTVWREAEARVREPGDGDDALTAAVDRLDLLSMLEAAGIAGERVGFDSCGPCETWLREGSDAEKSITVHDCGQHGARVQVWTTAFADLPQGGYSRLDAYAGLTGRERGAVMKELGLVQEKRLIAVDSDSLEAAAAELEAAAAAGVTTVAVPTTGTPMPDGSHRGEIVHVEVGADGLLRRAQRLRGAAAEVRAGQHPVVPLDGAVLLGADSVVGAPTVGANALQPMPEPELTAEEQAAAEAEALADKRDPYRHLPDPCTEELEELVFGDPRLPQVGQIRTAARAAAMSPWSTLGLSIGRGLLRVRASVLVPDLVGGMPAPLNYQIGTVGASGRGKGAAHGLVIYDAGVLIHTEESIDKKFMPPSGAALAGLFVARQKDDDGKVEVVPIREAAWCDWSEVDTLTAQSGRGGNDLASELRAAITGAELGTDPKKDGADPLKVEPLSYRILVSFSTQYGKPAMALMAERDGGTLQRTNWFSTTDPRSLNKRPRGPKPRAEIDIMRGLPTSHVVKHPDGDRELLTVDDAIHDEVWEAQAEKIRFDRDVDELAGHQNLNRLRTAAWAALIQHQAHIGAFEWEWAGHVMEHSRRVRDRLEASVKGLKKEQAQENGSLDFDRKNAAELAKVAHTEALLTSLAKWGRDVREGRNKFGKSGPTFTLRDIQASAKNAKSERYTRAAELATELCMRQLWVCEGERMRSVEPDPE
ncbi:MULTISPECIES: bifunctional DNA primase/polymerase [Mycolicibacterium]|uniref:Bifunctional DNA primase/polymerase n=2 Tax=Mycolicibacterium fortuitum TaxID=1766 RepID=A0AAE4VEA7_MYCFO|nr:bifunctional DNA primase/polymerase [Mycolicibacterium fortuitum]MCV7143587.1 bifunctional DNA primase/polymerase [Mycolicibacterium fortuitum]MDV7193164.1 bifunctional DNA primase/polymerase [Mycolicibacterium fortuitum]MDV7206469.1 bifunctional DNA primase/polymerase [Mycolicibacterium fortuitum]MDV7227996.1 bifunctional DNA primase/polymerase [Mycolicibacterium fortuitum]MDV7260358.1 bifunctional DNA primase/polymerase [Mycolicibacterium fortuitum]